MLGTVLLIILILALLGALPTSWAIVRDEVIFPAAWPDWFCSSS